MYDTTKLAFTFGLSRDAITSICICIIAHDSIRVISNRASIVNSNIVTVICRGVTVIHGKRILDTSGSLSRDVSRSHAFNSGSKHFQNHINDMDNSKAEANIFRTITQWETHAFDTLYSGYLHGIDVTHVHHLSAVFVHQFLLQYSIF